MLAPYRSSASSAASSAFCRSCSRFAASDFRRARTVASSVALRPAPVGVAGVSASGASRVSLGFEGWPPVRERERVRLMMDSRRSVKPRVASPPTAVSSCWAWL